MTTPFEFKSVMCSTGDTLLTTYQNNQGTTSLGRELSISFILDLTESGATLRLENAEDDLVLSLAALEAIFTQNPQLLQLAVHGAGQDLRDYFPQESETLLVPRSEFFQIPLLWHHLNNLTLLPERWTTTKDVEHPVRPRVSPDQVLYKRFIPQLQKTLTFRVVDPAKDTEVFHNWQNQERVAEYWDLKKTKEELKEYLIKGLEDPHQFPCFVEFDGVPVGYFEMYWVKEDRLGPYYDSEAYDRSFHILVGNTDYLGFKNTDAILKSVCHYLFLDEPRTRKIMAEPRYDNKNMLKYLETFTAWKKLKEFDFPHKRSALLECRRERYFKENYL